ncbi:MAG: hypothetical protein ACI9F9_000891 [Candidatus Paceibacteria bacterium]|jgi:hypothetical protein
MFGHPGRSTKSRCSDPQVLGRLYQLSMFLNPLGLLALLGVPAVIALHLFRRRFQRQRVSALFLWAARTTTSASGRRRDRILRSPSFWCELLLALLLAFAFAGPRGCGQLEAKHLVAVLDGSASMAAVDPKVAGDRSPAELAVEQLRGRIKDLPSGSRVTVIESGPRPRIQIGPAAFPEEALAKLEDYSPAAGRHDLAPAVTLATEIAGNGALTLFTDRFLPDLFPEQVGIVALGDVRKNLAIIRAVRFPGPKDNGEEDVFITIANFAGAAQSVDLRVSAEGQELARTQEMLPAGERKHFQFTLPKDTNLVEVQLAPDALEADNNALLVRSPSRSLALHSDLAPELATTLGLASSPASPIGRWLALVGDCTLAFETRDADFTISAETPNSDRTWGLVFTKAAGDPLDLVGPFLIEKRHPAVEGILLDGVIWSAGSRTRLPGTPLISAGNLVLLSEQVLDTKRLFHLNINWEASSLQRTPDWPILLANLASLRRRELEGPRSTNLGRGETFQYQLTGPGSSRQLRAKGSLDVDELDQLGLYQLRSAGETLAEFAVHFADDAESDLRKASTGSRASTVELGEERSSSSLIVLLLAVTALAALLLDWWVLRPKSPITHGERAQGATP